MQKKKKIQIFLVSFVNFALLDILYLYIYIFFYLMIIKTFHKQYLPMGFAMFVFNSLE